ncbi:GNAT family N-acetyltransferase [Gynuella sp.]|uniref:GNAT family N-acetyltransferase n=1 Tax=Gynuella sp. TaxID=2969146 RepID=UPI003D0BC3A8
MKISRQEIIKLHHQYERTELEEYGYQRIVTDHTIRQIADSPQGSFISAFNVPEDHLDLIIENEIDAFKQLGKGFEWKVYSYDNPSNIGARLIHHGLREDDNESFMVLDLNTHIDCVSMGHSSTLIPVRDASGVRKAIDVQRQIWPQTFDEFENSLCQRLEQSPETISMYLVQDSGQTVASGWITYQPNSPFAGLWGGSTLPGYRSRGHYRNLLAARAWEARERGVRYLTIDASEMSHPIVESLGFEKISDTRGYRYEILC